MIISCSFICVFAALINKVSLQVTVEGVLGGSVVLPCSSAEPSLKLQEVDVSWRHNGSKNVCDLIPRSNSIETQDPRYKNRAETFPEEYNQRNFSIKLTSLTHADAGKYICLITPSDEQETVELIISDTLVAEPTTEKGIKTTDELNQEKNRPTKEKGIKATNELNQEDNRLAVWITVGLLLTLTLVILVIVIIFRRKIWSCLKSGEHGVSSDAHEAVRPGQSYKSVTADDRDEAAKAGE